MSTAIAAQPIVLADALVGRRSLVIDTALIVAGAAVVAVFAQLTVPLWPVPVTGQTLAVMIVGTALGARRGAAALLVYLAVGLMGLPVFADFTGGPLAMLKPSFGFVIGFVFTAFVIGWLAERNWDRRFWRALLAFGLATLIPFVFGLPHLAIVLGNLGYDNGSAAVLAAGFTPFILGGAVKAVLAATITPLAWLPVRRIDRTR